MPEIKYIKVRDHNTAYFIFGTGKIDTVVEMGLGAVMGEWWHIAESLAAEHTVLLYERAGTGSSEPSPLPRTPVNIADELMILLKLLPHEEKLKLIGHSQGGLYVQQFARMFPESVKGIALLDPLSAEDNRFRELLTPEEFKKSGVDKFSNLRLPGTLAKLHLGFVIKAFMKSAPPFYYYKDFTTDARQYILRALTKPSYYETAMAEYRLAHIDENVSALKSGNTFPEIPLVLITHSSTLAEKETTDFGGASPELAARVEGIWQELMKTYLTFSSRSYYIEAEKSTHFIHLTQPELIHRAIRLICQQIY